MMPKRVICIAVLVALAAGFTSGSASAQSQLLQPSLTAVYQVAQSKLDKRAARDAPEGFQQSVRTAVLWQINGISKPTLKMCARETYVNTVTEPLNAGNWEEFVAQKWYVVKARFVRDYGHLRIRVRQPGNCYGTRPPGELGDGG
jgi:hypothetical protein